MSEHDPEPAGPNPRPSVFDSVSSAAPPVIDHLAEERVVERRRGGTPLPLTLLLTAALGGVGYWGWTHPQAGEPASPPQPAADQGPAIAAATAPLEQQIQALTTGLGTLETRAATPAPSAGQSQDAVAEQARKLDALSGQVASLATRQDQLAAETAKAAEIAQQKPAQPAAPPPDRTAQEVPGLIAQQRAADLGKLNAGLAQQRSALEQAQSREQATLDAQAQQKTALDALTQRVAALDALANRVDKVEQSAGQAQDQAKAQAAALAAAAAEAAKARQDAPDGAAALAALDGRVTKLEQGSGAAEGAVKDAGRAIRIEAAAAALQAGQPLGVIEGAPSALARFATAPPPTEGVLRADFPRVAEAARAVSQPDVARRSLLDRMLARVQQTVVVRRGDHVIVGDPAAGVLARAQDHVAAGDLRGAADVLGGLHGAAADAVRDWTDQVRALLAARAALASLAAGG